MRTYRELLAYVDAHYGDKAAHQIVKRWQIKQTEADKLSTLLSIGFIWFSDTTPYGVSYWQAVHTKLKAEEANQ